MLNSIQAGIRDGTFRTRDITHRSYLVCRLWGGGSGSGVGDGVGGDGLRFFLLIPVMFTLYRRSKSMTSRANNVAIAM